MEERIFVDVPPAYLTGLLKDRLEIHGQKLVEPYIGKWLRVTGAVKNVVNSIDGNSVIMSLDPVTAIDLILLLVKFDIKWQDRVHTLRENQQISVIGKIVTIQLFNLILEDCEFGKPDNV